MIAFDILAKLFGGSTILGFSSSLVSAFLDFEVESYYSSSDWSSSFCSLSSSSLLSFSSLSSDEDSSFSSFSSLLSSYDTSSFFCSFYSTFLAGFFTDSVLSIFLVALAFDFFLSSSYFFSSFSCSLTNFISSSTDVSFDIFYALWIVFLAFASNLLSFGLSVFLVVDFGVSAFFEGFSAGLASCLEALGFSSFSSFGYSCFESSGFSSFVSSLLSELSSFYSSLTADSSLTAYFASFVF